MSASPQRRAPPRRGRWLFLATLVLFWTLLALSGMDRFRKPGPVAVAYAIPAQALIGVTGLRLDEGGGNAPRPMVSVALDEVPEVRITLQSRRGEGEDTRGPPDEPPRLIATREGDTLILRWLHGPVAAVVESGRHGKAAVWVDEIVLPTQFRHLALARARVEARTPVERLEVAGQAIAVRGAVGHLDLWSTQCRPCEAGIAPALAEDMARCAERTRRGTASLEVNAARVRSLRVDARAGDLNMSETRGLERAALQLGDAVSVSVDRAAVLERARAGGEALQAPSACSASIGASMPVELLPARASFTE